MTETNHYFRALAAIAVMALMACLLAAKPAHASTTFTVNSTGDGGDRSLDDSLCDASFLPGNQCTLRAAIEEANYTDGADAIHFNIGGNSDVKTISPTSSLPLITEAVNIDGYSQPGAEENTLKKGNDAVLKIELNGTGAGQTDGLLVFAPNVVIKGLVIGRFSENGIVLSTTSADSKVEGNFIGTDPSGTQDRANGADGVIITVVAGDNTIGGASPAARNLISGNTGSGIEINSGANEVLGNLIGTKKDGTSALGNSLDGVRIQSSASANTIGNDGAGSNVIASNGRDGVVVASGTGNRILGNSIFSNGGLGIDLVGGTQDADGRTANDPPPDTDSGPNDLQNYPALTSAKTKNGKTTIKGSLDSLPNHTFEVQFFSNPAGADEGKKFIGQKSVTTGADNKVSFTFSPAKKVGVGRAITATATDADGNTSEFSDPREVVAS